MLVVRKHLSFHRLDIGRFQPFLTFLFLLTVLFSMQSAQAQDVGRIDIVRGRPLSLLPYDCISIKSDTRKEDRDWIEHPIWVWRELNAKGDSAQILFGGNVGTGQDVPAQVTLAWFPNGDALSDNQIWLAVTDLRLYPSSMGTSWGICGGGVRNDSAYFFTISESPKNFRELFLGAGEDSTGDGRWSGKILVHLIADYDFDGLLEAFVEVNPERDLQPKTLSCIEISTLLVEWTMDVPSCIRYVANCNDRKQASVFLATSGCGAQIGSTDFDPSCGYLTKIDSKEQLVQHQKISGFSQPVQLLALHDSTHFVITHYTSLSSGVEVDTNFVQPQISLINNHGNAIRTAPLRGRPISIWESEFDDIPGRCIFVLLEEGQVCCFDSSLQLLTQSDESDLREFRGELSEFAGVGPVWVFFKGNSTGIYDRSFRELARVDVSEAYVQNLGKTRNPPSTAFILSSRSSYTIFETRRKGLLDTLLILYVEYRLYVVGLFAGLIGGLAMVFYSRGRTKRDLATIRKQKQELEDIHRELKAAQAVIVEQEKYRQAKDIAGGFAHEIKNALFPADGALIKQERLLRDPEPDLGRILATHQAIRSAMARAIDLTRQITIYTKLETEVRAEAVNLQAALNEITSANEPAIKERNIMLALTGPSDAIVNIRSDHLGIVLNNLLLNSIEALTDRKEPRIEIDWQIVGNQVVINWFDNGSGINDINIPRIFDAFFSTKPTTGTGLGLSVSKKIIELYGGSTSVESKVGEGTRFRLRLPMSIEGSDSKDDKGKQ